MASEIPGCLLLYENTNGDDRHRNSYLSEKTPRAAEAELNQFSHEGWSCKVLRVIRLSDLDNGASEAETLSKLLAAILPNCGGQRDPWAAVIELIERAVEAWEETS